MSAHLTATVYSSNQKPTFSYGKPKNKTILGNYTARLQNDCFFVFPRKSLFSVENHFFLGKNCFTKSMFFPLSTSFFL